MEKIRNHSWTIAFVSALAAVGLHFYLTTKYYALRFGALTAESSCNLNDLWNCDAVSASQYSQLFGIPLAAWGLVTNLIFAFMLLFTRINWFDNDDRGRRYVYWYAVIIALASVVMGGISLTLVKSFCLYCVLAYVCSIIAFFGTKAWAQPQIFGNFEADFKSLFQTHHVILGSFIAIPLLAFFMNFVFMDKYGMDKLDVYATEKIGQWKTAPMQIFETNQGLTKFKGTGSPQMEVVEFADFRCPHCKNAKYSLDSFAAAHPDVRFLFKYYPLDGTCNESVKGGGDGVSCEAAFVVHCSEKLFKRGWDAHSLFFEKQDELRSVHDKQGVRDMACKGLNYDCDAMKACVESSETINEVRAMAAEGARAKITGTPTIFVNGRLLGGGQLIPILEKAYQSLKSN